MKNDRDQAENVHHFTELSVRNRKLLTLRLRPGKNAAAANYSVGVQYSFPASDALQKAHKAEILVLR